MLDRPQKITLAEMRASGVRGLLIYCSDYHCSHWTAISGDPWPDDVRLSNLEPFTCHACGTKGADVSELPLGGSATSPAVCSLPALHTTKEAYAFTVTMVVGSVLEPGLLAHVAS